MDDRPCRLSRMDRTNLKKEKGMARNPSLNMHTSRPLAHQVGRIFVLGFAKYKGKCCLHIYHKDDRFIYIYIYIVFFMCIMCIYIRYTVCIMFVHIRFFYSTLLYSTLLYSTPLHSTLSYLPTYLPICLSTYLCLSIYLSIDLSVCLSVCLCVQLCYWWTRHVTGSHGVRCQPCLPTFLWAE